MEEEAPPVVLESMVLAVAHHWSRKETKDRQVELLERHFRQDEVYSAHEAMNKLVKKKKPSKRYGGGAKTATRAQAEDLVEAMIELGNQERLPRFLVQSDDLQRVLPLLGALSVSDERSVAARLEALEASQRQNMLEVRRMVVAATTAMPSTMVVPVVAPTVPEVKVTKPSYAGAAGVGGAAGGGAGGRPGQQFLERLVRADRDMPVDQQALDRLTRAEQGGRVTSGRGRVERSRSGKRQRLHSGEEEVTGGDRWEVVNHQKPKRKERPKAASGTSNLPQFVDLAGPAEFWVGNTRSSTTKEEMEETLVTSAKALDNEDFKVEQVVCLTKDENPRTRTWKVSVPARFREVMGNPGLYPPGWSFRPFTVGPRRKEGGGAPPGRARVAREEAV